MKTLDNRVSTRSANRKATGSRSCVLVYGLRVGPQESRRYEVWGKKKDKKVQQNRTKEEKVEKKPPGKRGNCVRVKTCRYVKKGGRGRWETTGKERVNPSNRKKQKNVYPKTQSIRNPPRALGVLNGGEETQNKNRLKKNNCSLLKAWPFKKQAATTSGIWRP